MNNLSAALLLLACASTALAQTDPSLVIRAPITRALAPPNPQIEVTFAGEKRPGELGSFTIHVSGLTGASEAHLTQFRPGCGFEVQPNISGTGLAFQRDVPRSAPDLSAFYTTMTSGAFVVDARLVPPAEPTFAGVAVDNTGSFRITVPAVAGITGDTFPTRVAPTTRPGGDAARHVMNVTGAFLECIPKGRVLWKDRATSAWQAIDLAANKPRDLKSGAFDIAVTRGSQWTLERPVRQTIAATKVLAVSLEPAMSGGVGTCSGKSETLSGSFPVGVRTVDDDIAFTIRSGPLGTRCVFALKPLPLPNGVTMDEVRISVSKVGDRCRLGSRTTLPTDLAGIAARLFMGGAPNFSLDRVANQILQPTVINASGVATSVSAASWVNPFTFPEAGKTVQWQTWAMPLTGVLECDVTALNDHEVTLRIDSLTYSGPPGTVLR